MKGRYTTTCGSDPALNIPSLHAESSAPTSGSGDDQEAEEISQAALAKDLAADPCSPFQIPFREQFAALAKTRGKTQPKCHLDSSQIASFEIGSVMTRVA